MEIERMILAGMLGVGLILLLLGWLSVFRRDVLWKVTRFGNALEGVASQRTDTWDVGTIVSGVVFMILGGSILLIGMLTLVGVSLPAYPTSRAYTVGTSALVDQAIGDVVGPDALNHPDHRYYLVPVERGDVSATMLHIQRHYTALWRMRCAASDWSIGCRAWWDDEHVKIDLVGLPSQEIVLVQRMCASSYAAVCVSRRRQAGSKLVYCRHRNP